MTGATDPGEPLAGFHAPVHPALTEPILLWIAGLAIWAIGHALSVWVARRDPQFVDVARRHLRYPAWMRP